MKGKLTMKVNACLECSGEMLEIKLIDKGHFDNRGELIYASADAKIGFWSRKFPHEGRVKAYMCGECGRIALYGLPID
jgi:hypothetical protein